MKELEHRMKKMTKKYMKMLGYDENIEVKLCDRLKQNYALCHYYVYHTRRLRFLSLVLSKRCGVKRLVHLKPYLITYQRRFVEMNKDNEEALKWIVVHEVAHLFERRHNKRHKKLCSKFGVDASGFAPGTIFPSNESEKIKSLEDKLVSWREC